MNRATLPRRPLLLAVLTGLIVCCYLTACRNNDHAAKATAVAVVVPQDEGQFDSQLAVLLEGFVPELRSGIRKQDTSKLLVWQDLMRQIYDAGQYRPYWVSKTVLSGPGKQLYALISQPEYLGLNPDIYERQQAIRLHDSLQRLQPAVNYALAMELELELSRLFLQVALHLDRGMFTDTAEGIRRNFIGTQERYLALFDAVRNGTAVDSVLYSIEPDYPDYTRLMKSLRDFVSKHNISGETIRIRDPKTDANGALEDARYALVVHHYLADSLQRNDSAYRLALLQFQRDNGLVADGKIGLMTQRALERGDAAKFRLLVVNADRWRSEDIRLPERYVWVNIAATKLRIVERDTPRLEKNVVVGKADKKHRTPTLESGINTIVLWPTWTVPQSIIKNEMKSFKGYIVTRTGSGIQVVQPPGPNNSLGTVKMLFPNKYSVYLHDTPSKYLFQSDYRAHSHGCVRCQDALEVAAYLLQMDSSGISYDSLQAIRDSAILTRSFRLKKPVPVFFRYYTAEADLKGNLHFYTDIYRKDADMLEIIFGEKAKSTGQ